jgi:hypothetical protein
MLGEKEREVVAAFVEVLIRAWEKRGFEVVEGEGRDEVAANFVNTFCRLATCEAAHLMVLQEDEESPTGGGLWNSFFGPSCDANVVSMLKATRTVARELTGLATEKQPNELAAFLAGINGPAAALAGMQVKHGEPGGPVVVFPQTSIPSDDPGGPGGDDESN